jgi:hypothetical protein
MDHNTMLQLEVSFELPHAMEVLYFDTNTHSTIVQFVRTDVSEEPIASIIRLTRNGELGTTLAVTSIVFLRSVLRLLVAANVVPRSPILVSLITEGLRSSKTSVLTRATSRNIPEDEILHSHRRENIKSNVVR